MPRKYIDKMICAVKALIARSDAMVGSEGEIMLADIIGISCPKENIVPIRNLRNGGQL
jgi:hypothetical protein